MVNDTGYEKHFDFMPNTYYNGDTLSWTNSNCKSV